MKVDYRLAASLSPKSIRLGCMQLPAGKELNLNRTINALTPAEFVLCCTWFILMM
jgi:hypothetical protein